MSSKFNSHKNNQIKDSIKINYKKDKNNKKEFDNKKIKINNKTTKTII